MDKLPARGIPLIIGNKPKKVSEPDDKDDYKKCFQTISKAIPWQAHPW